MESRFLAGEIVLEHRDGHMESSRAQNIALSFVYIISNAKRSFLL